ncbi:hypothetical protein [Deinococcus alpinitundrae]|uniref:hypothetical protein n=1 Tax=Deinococcus alpinitundrae TaxID=468913 RepID=UPI00137AF94C|nr:hypothetical protein [Deinococcus alpinitundrae]
MKRSLLICGAFVTVLMSLTSLAEPKGGSQTSSTGSVDGSQGKKKPPPPKPSGDGQHDFLIVKLVEVAP